MNFSHKQIVVLDGYTLNPGDLDWSVIGQLGKLTVYAYTPPEKMLEHAREADIIIVNKAVLNQELLQQLPQLKCICVSATGFNNVDVTAAQQLDIPVCNVVGYGSTSVAQHVFALLLTLTNRIEAHSQSVKAGDWANSRDFCYTLQPIVELAGKTMGIYGFGKIGQQVGKIALAFGMNVLATHKHPKRDAMPGVTFVDLGTLFEQSDVVTLHAPLSSENKAFVNQEMLRKMKSSAYLINTGRGPLIDEKDLAEALKNQQIKGAGLDVLSQEPPAHDHPFYQLDNCIITPHQAWASKQSRMRLLNATAENVKAFLEGSPVNVVN